jgi:hypothetical protein
MTDCPREGGGLNAAGTILILVRRGPGGEAGGHERVAGDL